jgi:hypothetical protein
MTRLGPPNGNGPRSERKSRVAGERSHSLSDAGRASPTPTSSLSPLSKPTAPATPLASAALDVTLIARGPGRFDVSFDHTQIVTSSAQPMCDAARVLHRLGYSDDTRLVAWHEGSDHHAISGRLGLWRKRRSARSPSSSMLPGGPPPGAPPMARPPMAPPPGAGGPPGAPPGAGLPMAPGAPGAILPGPRTAAQAWRPHSP